MTVTELPQQPQEEAPARRPRWRPARAGILNVWRYYDEVFEFHNGRLLLRGPNGTGKSKALELLLPFLFDANLRANRLSTFGTGERTMHWNLMGEGATGTTRVGYVWLEFQLGESWFSCGARLQASSHTSTAHADYFTTSQRVGEPGGLELTNESGQPLTKAVLAETIGEHGSLHPNATEYRAAVRHALFPGLSEQRYDALITALLQLRTPKLSQRLDPGLLSTLLSRALPPLGQEEIAELAEGFERLDRQRERLKLLDSEAAAAKTVAEKQRTYAQRVLRAAADTLTSATADLEKLARQARESEEQYHAAVAENAETEQRRGEAEQRLAQARARIEGLTDSEAYQQGRELDKLRQQASKARRQAAETAAQAERAGEIARQDKEHAATAENEVERCAETVRAAGSEAERAARRADLRGTHEEIATVLDQDGRQARRLARAAVRGRQEQIEQVRAALRRHEQAVRARTAAEETLERTRAELAEQSDARSRLAATYDETVARQEQLLLDWARGCAELDFAEPVELAELAESEAEVLQYVEAVAARCLHAITAEETTLSARRDTTEQERQRLESEIAELRDQVDLPPEPPPHRTADRSAMTGAPLWKLVSFAEGIAPRTQAAVEAALQAGGLLDAWVSPSGELAVHGHDTFADANSLAPAARSLREVLRPEPDAEVPAETVERLLGAVAYGRTLPEHPAAIGADGTWRLGAVTGSWAKDEAEHIGAAARERNRQRRLEQLAARVSELDAELSTLATQLRVLADRRDRVAAERAQRPAQAPVNDARRALDRAEAEVSAADRAVNRAAEELGTRERAASEALHELSLAATTHRAPTDAEALDTLDRAVQAFGDLADTWLYERDRYLAAERSAEALRTQAARSGEAAEQATVTAEEAAAEAGALAETLSAVESTVGADYRQVLAEIEELRAEGRRLEEEIKSAGDRLRELDRRIGSLESRLSEAADKRDEAVGLRDTAAERFRRLVSGSFPSDAGLDVELSTSDGVRATLDSARAVAAKWPAVPHAPKNLNDAFGNLTEAVHRCRDALSGHADLELESDEDISVLTAVVDGARVGARELHELLVAEAERARGDITSAERELFDKTLTGDTRRQLADRIRQAGELVDAMNSRLERVRTASQVAVRLVWQVNPELTAGTKAARELLLKDPVRLGETDRESLHRFFRDRIEQARAENTASSWQEQLAQVFDYTAWHQFVVKLDRADGRGWQPLTKRMHGALSGGEKAIALHLPLFAAVAAHYESVPDSPRMILLDEVFVGVDSTNRGQVFELLRSLDLDLVLTSDHEWCAYRELPGIAVHQLITGADDEAVTTARFVWTGDAWADESA
ncbi:TIGR02680 family protein [Amycolatopsis cihanbeyliensis]